MTSIHASAFANRFLTSLLAPYLIAALRLTNLQFGLVQGPIFVLPYAVATPLFGALADRIRPRRVIVTGLVLWTLATLGCGLVTGFGQLTAARVMLGAGEAAFTPAALLLLGANVARGRFGRAVAVFICGASLGKAAAMLLGGLLLRQLQHALPASLAWRALFALAAIPNLLLLVAIARLADPALPGRGPTQAHGLGEHLRRDAWRYVALCLPLSAGVLVSQTLAAWAPLVYVRDFHLKPYAAGLLTGAVFLIFAPLGSLLGGALADRDTAPSARIGDLLAFLLLAGLAATGMLAARSLWQSAAGLAVLLTVIGGLASLGLVRLQRFAPAQFRATLTSIYQAAVTLIGFGLGPPLVGLLADRWTGAPGGLSRALLTVLLGACLVGLGGGSVGAGLARLEARHDP